MPKLILILKVLMHYTSFSFSVKCKVTMETTLFQCVTSFEEYKSKMSSLKPESFADLFATEPHPSSAHDLNVNLQEVGIQFAS